MHPMRGVGQPFDAVEVGNVFAVRLGEVGAEVGVASPQMTSVGAEIGRSFAAASFWDCLAANLGALSSRMVPSPAGRRLRKPLFRRVEMPQKATLFVCHGDDGGPRFHPCRRVQESLRGAGIEYQKVIAGHGSPIPFLRRGSRDQLFEATGTKKLPTLKLPDGTIISHSRAILAWVREAAGARTRAEASRVSASSE
jgi:hypothetical protein